MEVYFLVWDFVLTIKFQQRNFTIDPFDMQNPPQGILKFDRLNCIRNVMELLIYELYQQTNKL